MRTRALLFITAIGSSFITSAQNKTLGVGIAVPNSKAALHVESPTNNQGFIMPRLTTALRTAISGLASTDKGLMVYDTDFKAIYIWDGTEWNAAAKLAIPYNDTISSAPANSGLFGLYYNGSAVENVTVGYFENANPNNGYPAVAVRSNSNQTNSPTVYASNSGTNAAGIFIINNAASGNAALYGESNGTGPSIYGKMTGASAAGFFKITNAANANPALYGESNGSGPATYGYTTGTGPAGRFQINNASSTSQSIYSITNGTGVALHAETTNASTNSAAIWGASNSVSGYAANFRNTNVSNFGGAIYLVTYGTGSTAVINHRGSGGNIAEFQDQDGRVARIDKTGKGFFNGGTQTGGADVAEMFDVEGERNEYEPGDVLVISEDTDRTVQKSFSPSSTKVAGVYATKPGVILTEKNIEETTDDLVPMGVVGVIPTKVCLENGPIKRGDLLVTSSTTGHAMKAIPQLINGIAIYPAGAILGKALENFGTSERGVIKVLVNVK